MTFKELTMDDMKGIDHTTHSRFHALIRVACRARQMLEIEETNNMRDHVGECSDTTNDCSTSPPKPKRRLVHSGPQPAPPLPEKFKNAILNLAGGKSISPPMLVIQKGLFDTDLSEGHNRISIPTSRISGSFLTEEEKNFLGGRNECRKMNYKEVRIIEPSLEWNKARFSRWDMAKGKGKTCSTYVIKGTWRYIVERNGLRVGNVVQIWAFRIDGELCFAVVKLPS